MSMTNDEEMPTDIDKFKFKLYLDCFAPRCFCG